MLPTANRVETVSFNRRLAYLFLATVVLLNSRQTIAQTKNDLTKLVKIPANTLIRVKIVGPITSAKIKIGDYVQFKVADDILIPVGGSNDQVVIKKDTIGYGRVVEHKNRRLIFKPGRVGVTLEEIAAADGTPLKVWIARHQNTLAPPAIAALQSMPSESLSESQREPRRVFCLNYILKNQPPSGFVPCIQGRAYVSAFTATLPSSIVAAIASTLVGIRKDPTAKAYAEISLANNLASQSGLSAVLNGAYSEFGDGELFDARTTQDTWVKVKIPAAATGGLMIGRRDAAPDKYLITDYFADPSRYPDDHRTYNGMVIERIVEKEGETMRMCNGQNIPPGFDVIDRPYDPSICPREPGDATSGPTYVVIQRNKSL